MPMPFLYTFLVLSFFVSSVSQTFCAARGERKGAPLDFEALLSLTQGSRAIAPSSSSQKPEVAETIRSLMPLVRGQVHFMKGFQSLVSAKDADSVGYMKMLRGLIGDNQFSNSLKGDAQVTGCFSEFLCQSLEQLLRIHAQVRNKTGAACVGVMNSCLGDLWKEINEVSNRTVGDVMGTLALGWQVEDPQWSVSVTATGGWSINYVNLITPGSLEHRRLALIDRLSIRERDFYQLASDAGQAEFYALCGDNVIAVQNFEELMFYQKINAAATFKLQVQHSVNFH